MKDNNRLKKIVLWSLFIGWMIIVFYMSNQPASISDTQSGLVIKVISNIGIGLQSMSQEIVVFIVRKIAHFSEYFILAVIAYNLLICYKDKISSAIFTVMIVFLYACTDEIHQLFIVGRNGCFRDVLIDTFGGSTFILVVLLLKYIKKNKKIEK